MVMLVSLQEAKEYLRVDSDDDDNNLTLLITGASAAIVNYMKDDGLVYEYELDSQNDPYFDSQGEPVYILDSQGEKTPLPEIKVATLLLLGVLYTDRMSKDYVEPSGNQARLGDISLPRAVHWILDPIRKPTIK